MKKIIVVLFVAFTLFNCKNKEQKIEDSNSISREVTAEKPTTALDLGCYIFNDGKNSVSLEITENGKEIKGNLKYTLAEKDKNSGFFTGQLKGAILIGNYTFQSEGKESTREIAFKVDGDKLIEGYGALNDEGTAFKNTDSLSFTSKMPLTKTDCGQPEATCLFEYGKAFSELEQRCLELESLKTKLNPLKNGSKTEGSSAYLLFNSDHSKVEVFLPKSNKGIVLKKSTQGNWVFKNYTLIAWKGYVLKEEGVALFGG